MIQRIIMLQYQSMLRTVLCGCFILMGIMMIILISFPTTQAQEKQPKKKNIPELKFPPTLPDGKVGVVSDTSDTFLKPTAKLGEGVIVAKKAPTIDFAFFPNQNTAGNPWSAWGDSVFSHGKYYTSIGDHLAPAGNAFVYEYDPTKKMFRQLIDLRKLLQLPEGHYSPGKIHTQLGMGDDGWLYFATHRGSTRVTTDQYHYKGDWIIRCNPETGKSEVVAHGPVPKHCIPTGFLDPKRLIFYGGTAPGNNETENIHFFAYDAKNGKLLCSVEDGPQRAMIFARSTGRVYYVQAKGGALMQYDPMRKGDPRKIEGDIGLRAASDETADGLVYTVSQGRKGIDSELFVFNTKTEKIQKLGPVAVGVQQYITSLDIDASGRYLYYVPGAHGGADADGSPVVQYDLKLKQRKVIAFLHPFYKEKYGCALVGTYSVALSENGDQLFITWNANRGVRAWDVCALTVIHIPEAERTP
jgi:hypothetical protein